VSVENTLTEREGRYGAFADHARLSQHLTDVMRSAPKWDGLSAVQKEALEMIQHKVARILNGDPRYVDNWHDIAGYATLVEKDLQQMPEPEQGLGWQDFKLFTGQFSSEARPLMETVVPKEPGDWTCRHGSAPPLPAIVPVGEACPVCFATR